MADLVQNSHHHYKVGDKRYVCVDYESILQYILQSPSDVFGDTLSPMMCANKYKNIISLMMNNIYKLQ